MVRISDSELEVMKVIWAREKATSIEIIEDLKGVKWNYNTIRTLIKRLLVKGAIEIVKKEGKTYTYKATVDEKEYKVAMTRKLLRMLYHDSIDELVLEYCDREPVSQKELKIVAEALNERIERMEEKNK